MGRINVNAELTVRDTVEPLPYFTQAGLVLQFTGFEGLPNTFSPDSIELELGNAADPANPYTKPVYATITYQSADWFVFSGTPTSNFVVPAAASFNYLATVTKSIAASKPVGIYESTVTVAFGAYGSTTCTIRLKVLAAPTSYITTVDKEWDYAFKTQEILNEFPDHYSPKQIKDSVVSKTVNASIGLELERIENEELTNFFTQRHMSLAYDTPLDTVFLYNLEELPERRTRKNLIVNGGFHQASNPYRLPDYWDKTVEFTDLEPVFQLINFNTHVVNEKSTGKGILRLNSHHEFAFGTIALFQEVDVSTLTDLTFTATIWYKRTGTVSTPSSLFQLYTLTTFDDPTVTPVRNVVTLTDLTVVGFKSINITATSRVATIEVGITYDNLVSIDPDLADNSLLDVHGITLTTGHNRVPFCTNPLDKPAEIQKTQESVSVIHGPAGLFEIGYDELSKEIIPTSLSYRLRNQVPTIASYRNRISLPNVVFSTGASHTQELRVVTSSVITELSLPTTMLGKCVAVRVDNSEVRHSYRLGFQDTLDETKIVIAPEAVQIQAITEDLVGRIWGVAVITNLTHMPVTKLTKFMIFVADKQLPKPPTHEVEANILDYPSYIKAKAVYHVPIFNELVYANVLQIEKVDRNNLVLAFDNGYSLIVNLKYYYYIVNRTAKQIAILDNLKVEYPTYNTLFL